MNDIFLTAKQDTQDSLRFLKRPINENGNLTFSESGEARLLVSLTAWEDMVGRRSEVPRSANKRRSSKVSSRETRLVMGGSDGGVPDVDIMREWNAPVSAVARG